MSGAVRETQARIPFDPLDAEQLAAAILTRRRRKCIAEGAHPEPTEDPVKCPRCGL